jgi:hypothetical protein
MICAVSLVVAFVPLLIGASCGNNSLIEISRDNPLPFLYDVNVLFIFLVSFPCLVILIVSDQQAVSQALENVQSNGTLVVSNENQKFLAIRWNGIFRIANVGGLILGVIVGALAAYANYSLFDPDPNGHQYHWSIHNHHLLPVGYIYLLCIFLFYAVVAVYAVRSMAIAFLLRDIASCARIHIVPLHPDGAGGLQPIGQLGLRNQYALTLIGVNVVLASATEVIFWDSIKTHFIFIAAPPVCYLLLAPVVFLAPLLPFRRAMLGSKAFLMRRVAGRIQAEFERLDQKIPSGCVTKEDEELVERWRKIGSVVRDLPVWPFDDIVLRKFFAAYIIPLFGAATSIATLWDKIDHILKR